VIRTDGSRQDLPAGRATAGTVWVGEGREDFLPIQIVPDLIDFNADVELAVVLLTYRDPDNGINESKTFIFSKNARAAQTWKVGRRNAALGKYDVDIQYRAYDRTKSSRVQQTQIEGPVLILDREPAPIQ
jgi:hypothetical protein